MRLAHQGLKGIDREVDLPGCVVLSGRNGSGKSTIASALRILALGYEPQRGRTEEATATLMRGSSFTVSATLEDGRTLTRTLSRKAKSLTWDCETSWIDSKKSTEHAAACLALFGSDQTSVEQLLDVRTLLNLSPDKRAGRLGQILSQAGLSVDEKLDRLKRYLVGGLTSTTDVTTDQVRPLFNRLSPTTRSLLKEIWPLLRAKLGEVAIEGAIGLVNTRKRDALARADQKEKAWREQSTKVATLPDASGSALEQLRSDISTIEQAIGIALERQRNAARTRALVTDADAAVKRYRREMDELEPRLAAAATESVALLEMEATRIAEALASLTDPSAELSQQILGRCDEEAELNEKRIRLASSAVSPATDAWRMVRACARQIETSTKVAATRKLAQQIVDVADQHLPSEDTPDTTADIRQIESRLETLRAERDSLTVRRDEVQAAYFRTKEELNEQRLTIQTRLQQAQAAGELTARYERAAGAYASAVARQQELQGSVIATDAPDVVRDLEAKRAAKTAELDALYGAQKAREALVNLATEREELREHVTVYTVLESAVQRLRAEEVSGSGGPLLERMDLFLEAAGLHVHAFLSAAAGKCAIGWRLADGEEVDIGALSAGEWVLFTAAFVAAILSRSQAELRILLCEAGECDSTTFARLLRGITAVQDGLTHAIVMTWSRVKGLPAGWELRVLDHE